MDVSDKASQTIDFLISLMGDKEGKEFCDEMLEVLTLCISGMIKASCCDCCYEAGVKEVVKQITKDFPELSYEVV